MYKYRVGQRLLVVSGRAGHSPGDRVLPLHERIVYVTARFPHWGQSAYNVRQFRGEYYEWRFTPIDLYSKRVTIYDWEQANAKV